jgi:hypothetical protein
MSGYQSAMVVLDTSRVNLITDSSSLHTHYDYVARSICLIAAYARDLSDKTFTRSPIVAP